MFKDFFNKKRKYAVIPSEKSKRDIPEGLMVKCPKCGSIQIGKELDKNTKVCLSCQYHHRLNAQERIDITLDPDSFVEHDREMISVDTLNFPGYKEKLEKHSQATGFHDAVITGEGELGGFPVMVAAMSFAFFGGSMGSVVGEKVTRAIESAYKKNIPLIIFSTSGGARMEESILSLMQMAKSSAALHKFNENGGLYISVITDPTFGGVPASFAMLGDYILAEPGAAFGFTGRRVIEQTIRQKLPDTFQTAEFNMKHGQVDKVVHRTKMRSTLLQIIDLHQVKEG